MLPKVPPLNYTQVPNVVIERMSEFTHTEFKVAILICRYTFGWHRPVQKMSYTFLENTTGLCRDAVSNAIKTLSAKGFLIRTPNGDSFEYSLNFDGDGLGSLPDGLPPSTPDRLGVVRQTDCPILKKEIKEREETKSPIASVCRCPSRKEYEEYCGGHSDTELLNFRDYDSIPWNKITGSDWRPFILGLTTTIENLRR